MYVKRIVHSEFLAFLRPNIHVYMHTHTVYAYAIIMPTTMTMTTIIIITVRAKNDKLFFVSFAQLTGRVYKSRMQINITHNRTF